jgi:hypothetical protein
MVYLTNPICRNGGGAVLPRMSIQTAAFVAA